MRRKGIVALFMFAGLIATPPVSADVWQEREVLERYVAQLDSLDHLLVEGERSADQNRRAKLSYVHVRAEINDVKLKIRHYLDAPTVPYEKYIEALNANH